MKRKLFKTLLISGLLILLLPLTTVVVLRKPNPKLLPNHQQNQVFLPTADGKALMGCVFLPADQPKANIIFLHGIRGNYGHFYETAQDFQQRGYNCMLVNLRGHGNSGDLTTSYGFREKHDMNEIASFLATKNDLPTGIWGTSIGGAVGLQALGEYPDEFAFGVIESTFTTLHEVVFDYFSKFTTIQNKNISNWLINTAATYTAFEPVAVQPERSAEQIQCPVFMAHGLADKKMNPAYSQRNFDAIPHANKALFFLEKANHQNVLSTGGQAYLDRVDRFLTTHLEDENK